MSKAKDLFRKQYAERKLTYQTSFPWLRKVLKKYLHSRYNVTIKILKGIQGERILDYGCGDGNLLFHLHHQFSYCYGLDIVSSRIKEAKNYVHLNLTNDEEKFHFLENDPDKPPPYPDGYFDVVICIAVLPLVYDPYFIATEFHRILRCGGYLAIECANFAYFRNRLKLLLGKLPTTTPTNISL